MSRLQQLTQTLLVEAKKIEAEKKLLNNQVSKLSEENNELRKRAHHASTAIHRLRSQLETKDEELNKLQMNNARHKSVVNNLKSQIAALKASQEKSGNPVQPSIKTNDIFDICDEDIQAWCGYQTPQLSQQQ